MSSTFRFVTICAIWALVFPFLVNLVLTAVRPSGLFILLMAELAVPATLVVAPFWIAAGMDNRSRWDFVARCVAMFLLLTICFVGIGGAEILIFMAGNAGTRWH